MGCLRKLKVNSLRNFPLFEARQYFETKNKFRTRASFGNFGINFRFLAEVSKSRTFGSFV